MSKPKRDFIVRSGDNIYTATESDGFPNTPIPGCFIKTKSGSFVSEMTVLRGMKSVKDKEGKVTDVGEETFQLIFYNNEGQRGYCGTKEIIKLKNGRTIAFKQMKENVSFADIPPTLMTKDAGERFINGENVEIPTIYMKLQTKQKRYTCLDWDPRLYDLATCWSVATYFFDVFHALAILGIFGSNDMGKTRTLKTIIYSSRKGLVWDDVTKASATRIAEILQATEGIDEYQDLEEWLKTYTRGVYKEGSRSPRVEDTKLGLVVKMFNKPHPFAFATKEPVEYGTFTRTTSVKMQKGDPSEDNDPVEYDFEPERDDLYISRLTQAGKVYEVYISLHKEDYGMRGRDWEIWHGLFTIAKMVSEEVFQRIKALAAEMLKLKKEQEYGEERTVLEAIESLGLPGKPISDKLVPVLRFLTRDLTVKIWELNKTEYSKDKWEEDYDFKKVYGPKALGSILSRMKVKLKYVAKGSERTITRAEFDRMAKDYGYSSN